MAGLQLSRLCRLVTCGLVVAVACFISLCGCNGQVDRERASLSRLEKRTLQSLRKVAEYPFYTLHYYADYDALADVSAMKFEQAYACSLFASLSGDIKLFGRNFDWNHSPALLLYTDPPDGYASISMVNLEFCGFSPEEMPDLTTLSMAELRPLLSAPLVPIDGMNEHGLAVGMAAIPTRDMPYDPSRRTVGSLGIIREMLDHAATAEEAVEVMERYNISMEGGPAVHYLVADVTGQVVLVEFYGDAMHILSADNPWYQMTNFLVGEAGASPEGHCWRYDHLYDALSALEGKLPPGDAMALLSSVAQEGTQWSAVYQMNSQKVEIALGADYERVYQYLLRP